MCDMCTLGQYEIEHVVCVLTAILANMQVRTSLTAVSYVVLLLKNLANATFPHYKHPQ